MEHGQKKKKGRKKTRKRQNRKTEWRNYLQEGNERGMLKNKFGTLFPVFEFGS